jgi:DNA repair exonuclease SbcCD ATPase subunit
MKLSSGARREVVEELLDLKIFSNMFSKLKNRQSESKQELKILELELQSLRQTSDFIMNQKRIAEEDYQTLIKEKEEELLILEEKYQTIKNDIQESDEEISKDRFELLEYEKKISLVSKKIYSSKDINIIKKSHLQSEHLFFDEHTECPSCQQNIDRDQAIYAQEGIEEKIKDIDNILLDLESKIEKIKIAEESISKRKANILLKEKTRNGKQIDLRVTEQKINEFKKYIKEASNKTEILATESLKDLNDKKVKVLEKKSLLEKNLKIYEQASVLLKDTGIKSKVLKKYIPVLNQLVNKYLNDLSFSVEFHLDENFVETIKSRYRDVFSYSSFSEGQKQKIDTALIFSWRDIARLRNSVNMNLLFLDESLDSHLDGDSTDDLMILIERLPEYMNIFAISHKSQLVDKFHSQVNFELKNNFSRISN